MWVEFPLQNFIIFLVITVVAFIVVWKKTFGVFILKATINDFLFFILLPYQTYLFTKHVIRSLYILLFHCL